MDPATGAALVSATISIIDYLRSIGEGGSTYQPDKLSQLLVERNKLANALADKAQAKADAITSGEDEDED